MRSRPRILASSSRRPATLAGLIEVGKRVVSNFAEHRMATYAAALAYRGLFGLFPFMLLLVMLLGIFGPPKAVDRLVEEAKAQQTEQFPQQLQPVVEQGREQIKPLEDVARRAQKQADGELILIGIGVALWSVSALASTLADAFNTAYGLVDTRRWWKVLALSLASGPIVALAVIVAVVLMLAGTQLVEGVAAVLGLRELFVLLWGWLHYPVALVLLWVALSFVYRYSPAVTQPLRSVWLGAALAVLAWAVTSVGFSFYLANFADYGVTYGSLGAAVGLLVYLDLSASIVLAGAEMNAALHPSSADSERSRASERAGEL
ncbi:MAG: YihY/virulence factor BrkB family protein [Rubrobacteraceae bacterium]|nr:YihY/virulence factor BrkB family protein [Rubrobacteraceae bacterium]